MIGIQGTRGRPPPPASVEGCISPLPGALLYGMLNNYGTISAVKFGGSEKTRVAPPRAGFVLWFRQGWMKRSRCGFGVWRASGATMQLRDIHWPPGPGSSLRFEIVPSFFRPLPLQIPPSDPGTRNGGGNSCFRFNFPDEVGFVSLPLPRPHSKLSNQPEYQQIPLSTAEKTEIYNLTC